jgi:hypothetical protein
MERIGVECWYSSRPRRFRVEVAARVGGCLWRVAPAARSMALDGYEELHIDREWGQHESRPNNGLTAVV